MATYQTLRDEALALVGGEGQLDLQSVAEKALYQCMKWVAFHVRVPSLTSSATATAPADAHLEDNAITLGASGFNVSSTFQCVDRLYVKNDSTTEGKGIPYDYYEYHHFLDLINIPGGYREYADSTWDEAAEFRFTITPSNKLWAQPLSEGNVLTLFFRIEPAAYNGSGTPEILPLFNHILVEGAVLVLKEWLREPAEIMTMWNLFENGLKAQREEYDRQINGTRKRTSLRMHRSYRII